MVKYSCTNCLKDFTQKSHYIAHLNKKNPCNNIDKIKECIQTIINETLDIKLNNIINKNDIVINKKIELHIDNNINKSITNMNNLNKPISDMNKLNNDISLVSKKKISKNENINEDTYEIIDEPFKQKKGLKRNTIDKYYTKPCVVEQCIELVKKYINISNNDLIIEPSAGNGSFVESIKILSTNYKFYDLEPEHNEVYKQDFLEFDYKKLKQKYTNIHIIGNPPFGRQASLAIKFIKKCCVFSNTISFILPKSFKKDSMKKSFEKHYHLIYEIDLLENSFLVNGIESDVPCVFQIWQYKEEIRNEVDKQIPLNFKFVRKEDSPDISFRRVGVNAGTIMKEINNKSCQSHYFIKFTNNKTIDKNIEKLKLLKFNFNNTVGPKSISKPELIDEFNKLL
jgi:predicted RNA methylase